MQPVPRPVVCTAPSCATAPLPLSTCCHRPLHAAAALYTPPPPSTCRHRPLHVTTALYTPPSTRRRCPLHATTASLSVPPLLPLCAIAGLTTGCCLYVRRRPCLWPSCTRHAQPGPLRAHIAITRISPVSTPLTRAHAPPLCTPHVLAPIVCALASWAPSAAVPHVSAPVACALASWAPSVAMRCDHVTMFTSRSCATGWHTRIGRAWETVDTL